jgi:hypothetical protein
MDLAPTSSFPETFKRRRSKVLLDPCSARLIGNRAPPPIHGLVGGQRIKSETSTFIGATGNRHAIAGKSTRLGEDRPQPAAGNMSDSSPKFTDSSPSSPPPNSAEPAFVEPLAFLPPNISDIRLAQPYFASSSNLLGRIPTKKRDPRRIRRASSHGC